MLYLTIETWIIYDQVTRLVMDDVLNDGVSYYISVVVIAEIEAHTSPLTILLISHFYYACCIFGRDLGLKKLLPT